MKKLLEKDKKTRYHIKNLEKKKLLLKIVYNNTNFSSMTRFNASHKLHRLSSKTSKTMISNRCVLSVSKKKFQKLSSFSRIIFLRLARKGFIHGLTKSSW